MISTGVLKKAVHGLTILDLDGITQNVSWPVLPCTKISLPIENCFIVFIFLLFLLIATPEGWYLYLETSYPRVLGEIARISSPVIKVKTGNDNCRFRMFYHMFGKDVNSLKIYYRNAVGGKLSVLKTIIGKVLYKASLSCIAVHQRCLHVP